MPINYEIHDSKPATIAETRDRFIQSAMWNCRLNHCQSVSDAFDQLGDALSGSDKHVSMYQSSPSGSRTEYALVLHTGPRADQRRYFRPGAVIVEYDWEIKRGRKIPYTEVVEVLKSLAISANRNER